MRLVRNYTAAAEAAMRSRGINPLDVYEIGLLFATIGMVPVVVAVMLGLFRAFGGSI